MDVPRNLGPGAFAGTAELYARYRPPYPRALLGELLARAGLGGGRGVLVDLATGPGRIALDLAPSFERVVAIDLDPEMITVGRRRAAERAISNVEWRVGRAEQLEMPVGGTDLVTIGEAFHRLEQSRIAERAFGWLRPGGAFATLGSDDRFSGSEPWEITVRRVREPWRMRAFPGGWATVLPGQGEGPEGRARAILAAGFGAIEDWELDEILDLDVDAVVGYLASTSTCSRAALGEGFEAFEVALRAALKASGEPTFRESIRWGFSLARKPAASTGHP